MRLEDVEEWSPASEPCNPPKILLGLASKNWLSRAEYDFLRAGKRVELNAFMSADFIAWIESKLNAFGVKKVVPKREVLRDAYRKIWVATQVQSKRDEIVNKVAKKTKKLRAPRDIVRRVEKLVNDNAEIPWDEAVRRIVLDRIREDGTDLDEEESDDDEK